MSKVYIFRYVDSSLYDLSTLVAQVRNNLTNTCDILDHITEVEIPDEALTPHSTWTMGPRPDDVDLHDHVNKCLELYRD